MSSLSSKQEEETAIAGFHTHWSMVSDTSTRTEVFAFPSLT